jgi:hypothetical protein
MQRAKSRENKVKFSPMNMYDDRKTAKHGILTKKANSEQNTTMFNAYRAPFRPTSILCA